MAVIRNALEVQEAEGGSQKGEPKQLLGVGKAVGGQSLAVAKPLVGRWIDRSGRGGTEMICGNIISSGQNATPSPSKVPARRSRGILPDVA